MMNSISIVQTKSKWAIIAALLLSFFTSAALADPYYTPYRGTKERKEILNAIRPTLEAQLYKPVQFVVSTMRVGKGWAFVAVKPQRPGGIPIDIRKTRLAQDADMYDGLKTWALVKKTGRKWRLVTSVIGPVDAAWASWERSYGTPNGLIIW